MYFYYALCVSLVQVEEGEEVPEVLKGIVIVKAKSVDTSGTTNVEPSENL